VKRFIYDVNPHGALDGGVIRLTATSFNQRFLSMVADIERACPVAQWRSGDVEVWPLARMDLYLDMFRASMGGESPRQRALPLRLLSLAATPLRNLWKSRRDMRHWIARAKAADAIFLGDGVSLDFIDGAWQDRFGEPIFAALEQRGLSAFVMQNGDLSRLPWHRATYAANTIARLGAVAGLVHIAPANLPGHEQVLGLLADKGVVAASLSRRALERRAAVVSATASAFERVLRKVRPRLAFVVTYYAGLGAAFLLACRRQGILSVDLQHCPQYRSHKAYHWEALPESGFATLPAVFWNWTTQDADNICRWAGALSQPWHRGIYGGHTQFLSLFADTPLMQRWNAKFDDLARGRVFAREILVALQPVGGFRASWDALAQQIQAAPSNWRWWIRRHPAAAPYQDAEYSALLALRMPNVMVEDASRLPLPILLPRMNVVISQFSGASMEGSLFGVPAIFLSDEARTPFAALMEAGLASIESVEGLIEAISALPATGSRSTDMAFPDLNATLARLEQMALDYRKLCASRESAGL
jgi:hypothetical protein